MKRVVKIKNCIVYPVRRAGCALRYDLCLLGVWCNKLREIFHSVVVLLNSFPCNFLFIRLIYLVVLQLHWKVVYLRTNYYGNKGFALLITLKSAS